MQVTFKANLHVTICRADLSTTTNREAIRLRSRLQYDKSADSKKSVTAAQILTCCEKYFDHKTYMCRACL